MPSNDEAGTSKVGDRVVVSPEEIRLYSPEEHRLRKVPPLPDDLYAQDADITAVGRVVAACDTRGSEDRSVGRCVLDADSWTYTPQAEGKYDYPGIVATYSEHAAVTTIRGKRPQDSPAPSAAAPDLDLGSLTLLDGQQATDVDLSSLDPGNTYSMAVLDDGSVVMSGTDGRLTGVTPDGEVQPIDSGRFIGLTSTGDRVWARSLDRRGALYYSDDLGESWQETPMPGSS